MAAKTAQMQEVPAAADIDIVSLQISLPQMLDLALGAPEVKQQQKHSSSIIHVT